MKIIIIFSSLVLQLMAQNDIHFAVNSSTPTLYKTVSSISESDNIIISPVSITLLMSMIYLGAVNGSDSEIQLRDAFKFQKNNDFLRSIGKLSKDFNKYDPKNENVTILVKNSVFPEFNFDFEWEYQNLLRNNFHSNIQNVNYTRSNKAVEQINRQVAIDTQNLIPSLLSADALNDDTRLVLTSAVYFKSKWAYPFDKNDTFAGNFSRANGDLVEVDYMFLQNNIQLAKLEDIKTTILILPYIDKRFEMIIFKPDEGTSISYLENQLFFTPNEMERFRAKAVFEPTNLMLPKFEAEFETSLLNACRKMGIVDIFTDNAKLQEISKSPIRVSDIFHKTKLKVNEEGSEAAAASGVTLEVRGGVRFRNINVDSTFIFSIYDTEKKISLFIGKIDNPSGIEIERDTVLGLHSSEPYDKEEFDDIKIDTRCSGGSLEACIFEVCNFESVVTQKICIKNCEMKCKNT